MQLCRDGDYDLGMMGGAGSINPTELLSFLNNAGSMNFPCISDDRYVVAFDKAMRALSTEEQKAAYREVQQMMLDDMPIAYLYSQNALVAYNKRLSGVDAEKGDQLNWVIWNWRVAE